MAKKKNSDDFDYEIDEVIEKINGYPNSTWGKYIVKAHKKDKMPTIDIRHIRMGENQIIGKGISLTDEDCDKLTDVLVKRGYGSTRTIEEEIRKRYEKYGLSKKAERLRLEL